MPEKPLEFEYKNWKGKIGKRKVKPIKLWFGKTRFHPKKQWLLKALDLEKQAERDFAVIDILKFYNEN